MRYIELRISDRAYRWFVFTWSAIVLGITFAFAYRTAQTSIPFSEPIVRQANGTLEPEITGLRRENAKLKQIIRTLDTAKLYASDIAD